MSNQARIQELERNIRDIINRQARVFATSGLIEAMELDRERELLIEEYNNLTGQDKTALDFR